jgi:hypothetical protein
MTIVPPPPVYYYATPPRTIVMYRNGYAYRVAIP